MKKILSTLVMCLILGVGSVCGAATITINAISNPVNGGTVAVQTKTSNGQSMSYITWPKNWSDQNYGTAGSHGGLLATYTVGIYYKLTATANPGYYFADYDGVPSAERSLKGDYDSETIYNDITENPYEAITKYVTSNTIYNVIANFKPVTVDAMTIDGEAITSKTLNSTDKNGYREATIVFTTAHADNWNDFVNDAVVLEGDSRFKIQSSNRNGNTVTVVVGFTDDDHHVMDGTLPSATVSLTSKGDATSKKTATITATSDLTPKFEFKNSPLNLTPDAPATEEGTANVIITLAAKGYENVVANAIWSQAVFADPEDAARKGFTLGTTNNTETSIGFKPTAYSMNRANVETKVCITATYKDANGKGKEIPYTECVTVTADAGKVITIGGAEDAVMDFGIIDYTATNVPKSIEYPIYSTLAATAFTKTDSGFTTDISYVVNGFEGSATDGKLTVTVNSTMVPNDYTATLKYKETGATDPIDATLLVKVSIKLAKPVVTATVPSGFVTLNWAPVYGAKGYIIKSEGVEIATVTETTYDVKKIGGQELTIGRQYPFTVTAVYKDNSIGNRESDIVYATPGIPTEITYGTIDDINMYTGTEKGAGDGGVYESFPYSKKRKIELNRIFDASGNPFFDELYIFGVTTEIDGTHDDINLPSDVLGCNAMTPLYVYTKSDNKYVKTAEYDAVEKRFDHGTSKNGKHLYFTGYCPFAYMGTKSTENGWMYFKGGQGATVDIYLDSCQIRGRYKTPTGANSSYVEYELILEADASKLGGEQANESFLQGNSSPFLFTSTSSNSGRPYKPTFHIAGKNHLKGQLGSYITRTTGRVTILFVPITMDAGIGNIFTYSAPIAIKPEDLSTFTDLTLTDIWKDNTITNGYLRLDSDKGTYLSEKVMAIDLGSANGSLTINGGQYHLRNSAADGTYACNLAVGYRLFSKMVEKAGQKLLLHLYGFGGDMTDCKVTINSGTFTMYPNMYPNGTDAFGNIIYLGDGYYRDQENFMDLRLPAGKNNSSRINGGTFNGIANVCMCTQVTSTGASPMNAKGSQYWLCLQDVEVSPENMNEPVNFDIPSPFDKGYTKNGPQVNYDLTKANEVSVGGQYGGQSVNAYEKDIDGDSEVEKVVSLLLPGQACREECLNCKKQVESLVYQWATALPKFDAIKTVSGVEQDVQIGGPILVKQTPEAGTTALDSITNQLLFIDAEGMESYSMIAPGLGAKLAFNDVNMPRGRIKNTKDYTIENHLNLLKAVQADTWYTFTAPFNVHDISVIETNEKAIDVTGRTRSDALQLQAEDNLKILYDLQDFIIPTAEGRASSMTLPVMINMVLWSDGILDPSKPINLQPINPLTHYDGTNMMTAHYYLYELDIKDGETEFKTDGAGKTLHIKWKPVAKQNSPTDPILEAGKVYAMQFPWCPMCNDLYVDDEKKRTYYDYWSNKLILFHGNGPQTVSGTTDQSSLITTPTSGHATLSGNTTLADMTLTAQTAYVHNPANDIFELNNAQYVVKPTEGFLLYNPGANPMPARISRTGQIEYDENAETGVDGVPTVGDRTSLMLFGAYDGFEVLALHEQLVTVYNLQGNIIFQQYMTAGEQVYVPTGAGIYVVRGESEAIKVMID